MYVDRDEDASSGTDFSVTLTFYRPVEDLSLVTDGSGVVSRGGVPTSVVVSVPVGISDPYEDQKSTREQIKRTVLDLINSLFCLLSHSLWFDSESNEYFVTVNIETRHPKE